MLISIKFIKADTDVIAFSFLRSVNEINYFSKLKIK